MESRKILSCFTLGLLVLSSCRAAPSLTAEDVDTTPVQARPETVVAPPSETETDVRPVAPGSFEEDRTREGHFPRCTLPTPQPRKASDQPRCATAPPWVAEKVFPHIDCTGVMNLDWPRAGNILSIGTQAGLGSCHQTFPLVDRREAPRPSVAADLGDGGHIFSHAGSVGVDLWDMDCSDLEKLLENNPAAFDTILVDGGPESIGGPLKSLSPELVGALDGLAADELILDVALMNDSELSRLERLAPKLHGLRISFLDESAPIDIDLSGLPEMPCLRLLSLAGGYEATVRNVSKLGAYSSLRHLSISGLLSADEVGAFEGLDQIEELSLFLHKGTVWPNLGKMKGLKSLRANEEALDRLQGLSNLERLIAGDVDDADLQRIGALSKLKGLEVYLGEVTEKGLEHLDKLRSLRAIHVGLPEGDADVMKHLGRLKELRTISVFDQSVITDSELAKLTGLRKLERINTLIALEEAGFRHLSKLAGLIELPAVLAPDPGREFFAKIMLPSILKLRALQRLDLRESAVEDGDLTKLRRLSKLRRLDLSGTQIGDAACAHLAKISALEELDLSDTKVTGVGLVRLRSLTSLRYLGLAGTGVTEEEASLFEKARPSCDVEVSW